MVPNSQHGRGTGTAMLLRCSMYTLATEVNLLLLITTTGTVWLNYLDCSAGDEVIEDCSHRGWGLSYCSPYDHVGVVWRPNGICLASAIELQ